MLFGFYVPRFSPPALAAFPNPRAPLVPCCRFVLFELVQVGLHCSTTTVLLLTAPSVLVLGTFLVWMLETARQMLWGYICLCHFFLSFSKQKR